MSQVGIVTMTGGEKNINVRHTDTVELCYDVWCASLLLSNIFIYLEFQIITLCPAIIKQYFAFLNNNIQRTNLQLEFLFTTYLR